MIYLNSLQEVEGILAQNEAQDRQKSYEGKMGGRLWVDT
jgi:hypothetical protein